MNVTIKYAIPQHSAQMFQDPTNVSVHQVLLVNHINQDVEVQMNVELTEIVALSLPV